jgi:hypothetical protein
MAANQHNPAAMKTAPKIVTLEMVLKLRWKIWGISLPSSEAAGDTPANGLLIRSPHSNGTEKT